MPPKRIKKPASHLPETTTQFSRFLAQLENNYQETIMAAAERDALLRRLASAEARDALLDRQRRALETLALEYPDEEDVSLLRRAAQLVSLLEYVKSMTAY